jgi:2-dehydro-3-deoxyphosphooctonate aldolase (KDO 8-P synthase)
MVRTQITDSLAVGDHCPLTLFGGPCVIESEEFTLKMAREIKKVCDRLKINFVFKSSFDKANRTSIDSFRGYPIEEGLKILQRVKDEIDVPLVTDIHLPEQAAIASCLFMSSNRSFGCCCCYRQDDQCQKGSIFSALGYEKCGH